MSGESAEASQGVLGGDRLGRARRRPLSGALDGDGRRLGPGQSRRYARVHNAEVLAGVTLAQLTSPGTPMLYGSSTTAMDLRLAAASVGSPECGVISAAVAAIARQYRLPSYVAGL